MSILSDTKIKGIVFITFSAVCFGSYGIWSRLIGSSFGEFSQGWIRGGLLIGVLIPFGLFHRSFRPIQKSDYIWFALVSLGGLNQAPYFYAFQHLAIGTATLLFYASLTAAGFLVGKYVLKEHIGKIKLAAFSLAIAGMLVLFEVSLHSGQLLAAACAVLAGAIGGIEITITKKISDRYTNVQILTILFAVMTLGNLPFAVVLYDVIPPLSHHLPWLAQLGYTASMLVALYCAVRGFMYLQASIGSLVGLTEILFAILFGVVLFGETITGSVIAGAFLIIAAAALPSLKEVILTKQ